MNKEEWLVSLPIVVKGTPLDFLNFLWFNKKELGMLATNPWGIHMLYKAWLHGKCFGMATTVVGEENARIQTGEEEGAREAGRKLRIIDNPS